jgi:signal transduction histidine kinase
MPHDALTIPISSPRVPVVGHLILGPRLSEQPYTASHRRLLTRLAAQLGLAYDIHNLALERVRAVAAERNRMARELHDTFAQGFAGISLHLESAGALIAPEPETAEEHVRQAQMLARMSLAEARRSVHDLRSADDSSHDLPHALRELARILSTPALRIEVSVRGDIRIPEPMSRALLRIAQESVSNAIKHSGASLIAIDLSAASGRIRLSVSDNGAGFDTDLPLPQGSFGLIGMRERAAEIGASLEILSASGVTVHATIEVTA